MIALYKSCSVQYAFERFLLKINKINFTIFIATKYIQQRKLNKLYNNSKEMHMSLTNLAMSIQFRIYNKFTYRRIVSLTLQEFLLVTSTIVGQRPKSNKVSLSI